MTLKSCGAEEHSIQNKDKNWTSKRELELWLIHEILNKQSVKKFTTTKLYENIQQSPKWS